MRDGKFDGVIVMRTTDMTEGALLDLFLTGSLVPCSRCGHECVISGTARKVAGASIPIWCSRCALELTSHLKTEEVHEA